MRLIEPKVENGEVLFIMNPLGKGQSWELFGPLMSGEKES
jgi:hypothetical protein